MKTKKNKAKVRVSPSLTRGEVEFLDRLGREAKFSGGRMLGHTEVVNGMIRALKTIKPNVKGVRTEDELVERILGA